MEIYAPSYCQNFKCIADKCKHSCCIDWEINIDEKTYEKYKSENSAFAKEILKNTKKTKSGAHFLLDKNGRCKNLDCRGLCKIITELGEDYLCDICRLHPRFFNYVGDRTEMGLGLSCEEAVRLALTDGERFTIVKIGENEEESFPEDFDALTARDGIIYFFENIDGACNEKIKATAEKYGISTEFYTASEWIDYLLALEILDEEWRTLLESSKIKEQKTTPSSIGSYVENLFKYLVFRHVSTATSELSFVSRLAFSLLGVSLVIYLFEREEKMTESRLFEIVRLFSSEIEYSEENTESLLFELEINIM